MGKKHALSQSHRSDISWSKSMEDLPIPNINAQTRNLKGLLTSFDTPRATQRCKTLPFTPLKTPSPNGILRKRENDARIMTTIQPLSMDTKPHKDPSFPSSLQTIQRKAQWSPATIKWKESPVKVSRCSSLKAPGNLFSLDVQSHPCKWLGFMVLLHHPLMPVPGHGACPVEAWPFMVRKGEAGLQRSHVVTSELPSG